MAGIALNVSGGAAEAACISNPPAQSNASFPGALTGKLVYHSYVKYGDGTSQIFLYDFSAHTLTRLSKSAWGITNPTNAPAGAEYSMPFLTTDASAVCYASGTGANMGLMKRTIATGVAAVFDQPGMLISNTAYA